MGTTALVSVEEYLKRTEKPNAEYIDGVVYPKAMGTYSHSLIQVILANLLRAAGLDAVTELTVRLSATKYLVPDVAAVQRIQEPYPTEPVLLCVEILSPDDRAGAMLAKCEHYHDWGVPYCWVIYPLNLIAWEYHKGGAPISAEQVLHAGDIAIPLDELFAELRAKRSSSSPH
jgi:Uma2 family endonuclease